MKRQLAQVVVGPAGEAAHPVGVGRAPAENDYRQIGVEA